MKIVITSGYFNPLHIGHIHLLKAAKQLGDKLIVIVNNDGQVKVKGSFPFMPEGERLEIIKAIKYVDEVVLSIDRDGTVIESLKMIAKNYPNDYLIFAKGGDRHKGNIPEVEVCREFNIEIVEGVGGGKIQSSSWLLNNLIKLTRNN